MMRQYLQAHRGWHIKYKQESAEKEFCDCSNGQCHPIELRLQPDGSFAPSAQPTEYRSIFLGASTRTAMACTMCPNVDRPHLAVPAFHPITQQPTGDVHSFCLPPRACHELTCGECGTRRTMEAAGMPNIRMACGSPAIDIDVFACKVEASDRPFTWNRWEKVSRVSEEDEDPTFKGPRNSSMQWEYVPYLGTRAEFMQELLSKVDTAKAHVYRLCVLGQWRRSLSAEFLQKVALGQGEPWATDTAIASTDYAARTSHPRPAEQTCARPGGSHLGVHVIRTNPRLVRAADLPSDAAQRVPNMRALQSGLTTAKKRVVTTRTDLETAQREHKLWTETGADALSTRVRNEFSLPSDHDERAELDAMIVTQSREHQLRVETATTKLTAATLAVSTTEDLIAKCAVVTTDNVTFFACSAEKGSAAGHHQALRDWWYIINHGEAPPNTPHEFFYNKQRLKGSCQKNPLPDGVTDATGPIDFGASVKRIVLFHDGCAAQYEGLKAYLGVQSLPDEMKRRYNMEVDLLDVKEVAHHGKGPHDPIGAEPGHGVSKACRRFEEDGGALAYPADSRGFLLAAVQAVAEPAHSRDFADLTSFNTQPNNQNKYIYGFYSSFDTAAVNAVEGYAGSSDHHFRRPHLQDHDGGEATRQLLVRQLPCWCAPCREANVGARKLTDFRKCLALDDFPQPRLVRLEKKSLDVSMEEIRQQQLQNHCADYCRGKNKVVVVRPAEKSDAEPYVLPS
jgi:hypothetical protein